MQTRVKAAYNVAKSLAINECITNHARVMDIGGGHGSELLKFGPHRPKEVIVVDIDQEALTDAMEFAREKEIKYEHGTIVADVFTDQLAFNTTLVRYTDNKVPRRVRLQELDVITTFSVVEYCPTIKGLHHLCEQVSELLREGGSWVGCITNADRVMERCDENGLYSDGYCTVQLLEDCHSYLFTTPRSKRKQYLWPMHTLQHVAAKHGLLLDSSESLLDLLGSAARNRDYRRIRQATCKTLKLQLDDTRPLSLLTFFCFCKPSPEKIKHS
jgi:hypothetical protein